MKLHADKLCSCFLRGLHIKRPDELADFCVIDTAPEARLSSFERLTLQGGAELERALQWIIRHSASFAIFDNGKRHELKIDLPVFLESEKFYTNDPRWSDNKKLFFTAPDKIPAVQSNLVHGLKDGTIIDLHFETSYQHQNPAAAEIFNQFVENKTVRARYWQHTETAKGTIVALHGWTMGDQRLNSLAFLPGHFYKLGYDVVLMELPFHGRRKPKHLSQDEVDAIFPGSDLALTNEVIGQFIHDLRSLKLFLSQYGAPKIGVIGMSLGGYFGSLWAALDELEFCIPIVPMVSMSDIAWKAVSKMSNFAEMKKQGLNKKTLERAYALHCPLSHQQATATDRILILAGLADNIVPSSHPRALWNHWGKPEMNWFRGGHMAQLKSRHAINKIVGFLKNIFD